MTEKNILPIWNFPTKIFCRSLTYSYICTQALALFLTYHKKPSFPLQFVTFCQNMYTWSLKYFLAQKIWGCYTKERIV